MVQQKVSLTAVRFYDSNLSYPILWSHEQSLTFGATYPFLTDVDSLRENSNRNIFADLSDKAN